MRIDPGTRVLLFDCYQTLIGIRTDEHEPATWGRFAAFLRGHGLDAAPDALRGRYHALVWENIAASPEPHPEFDVEDVLRRLLGELGADDAGAARLSTPAARAFRTASMRWLEVFPDTLPALRELGRHHRLGLVTDAQRVFLEAELRETGLEGIFEVMVVSSDLGYRKPDHRMFAPALAAFGARPEEALYVGDSLDRDVGGAQAAGLTGVLLDRHRRGAGGDVPVIASLDQLATTLGGG